MASGDEDGGPAFPVPAPAAYAGMKLRDWFAGQALAGLLASEGVAGSYHGRLEDAEKSYSQADAMLEARK